MIGASTLPRPSASPAVGAREIVRTAESAGRWLAMEVLPLWASVGHDAAHGGFFEEIGFEGEPVALPKRCRVQARQAYVFAEAGRLGWNGPWKPRVESAVGFMLSHHLRADGAMRLKTHVDGRLYDDGVDNYDQAFAIFGLAHAWSVDPAERYRLAAQGVLAALRRERAHPLGGFHETRTREPPLLSNPHMHLLEAALAWLDVDPQPVWRELAQEIVDLCADRFIDPSTRALREHFEGDWTPQNGDSGRVVEPGHQFEWAWLLWRWREFGGAVDDNVIRGLYDAGDRWGLDRANSLAVNEIWIDGGMKDGGARMWAQTERMKAALAVARLEPAASEVHEASAIDAWRGMQIFIDAKHPGLFHDKRRPDGSFAAERALASSLYHIVCAISFLLSYVERNPTR